MKVFNNAKEIYFPISDGATLFVGGQVGKGIPDKLVDWFLNETQAKDLTILVATAILNQFAAKKERLKKAFLSNLPNNKFSTKSNLDGVEIELLTNGMIVQRMMCAASGQMGFYTPVGVGTRVAENKEERIIDGVPCLFERPLKADVALIRAQRADRFGNLVYYKADRNYNSVMAMAAKTVIVQVDEFMSVGSISPSYVHTPGIFVDGVLYEPTH